MDVIESFEQELNVKIEHESSIRDHETTRTFSEGWSFIGSGLDFIIEVKHWYRTEIEITERWMEFSRMWMDGRLYDNCWNVYVKMNRKFPFFDQYEDEYENVFEFSTECTYHNFTKNDTNKVISKEYGCDYAHLDQDRFKTFETPYDAIEVFHDAKVVFNQCKEMQRSGSKDGFDFKQITI